MDTSTSNEAVAERQTIYIYGTRAWWTRLKLLSIYVIALFLLLAIGSSWDIYSDQRSLETLNPLLRSVLLFGMWLIAIVTAWRRGNSKIARISYLPQRDLLEMQTINGLTRTVVPAQVRRTEYQLQSYYTQTARPPRVQIHLRNGSPIEVDTACSWLDQPLFERFFPRHGTAPVRVQSVDGTVS